MPSGTVERRFRGASSGKGANLMLRVWIGSDEHDVDESNIPVGDEECDESRDEEGSSHVEVDEGISTVRAHGGG